MWILDSKMLSKKGFTLLELVVVTAIISILLTISYTSYKGYHRRSRVYSAKQDLSSIVAMAEVFEANTGFYLPNLRAMHIPIKGRYSYNYKVICHTDGTFSKALWETDDIEADTCGQFNIVTKSGGTPPFPPAEVGQLDVENKSTSANSCASSSADCWMGAVLCHHYSEGTAISCGTADYTFNFEDRGVMQWKSSDDDWTGANIKKKELAPLFNIVDFAAKKEDTNTPPNNLNGDPHCKRVSRKDDVFADPSDCFFNEEFAVDSDDVEAIIQANWTGDEEAFISTPSKLVVTALACKDRQDDCTGTSFEYSIIRMDTNRLIKIVQ